MQEWLTLTEAAEHFNCHYVTLLRNWPHIPDTDKVKVGTQKFVWGDTRWRPNRRGRPVKTYGGKTLDPKIRKALPDCPHDLSTVPRNQREIWLARIDSIIEGTT